MYVRETKQKNRLLCYLAFAIQCCIIASCAQIVAPTGGDRDKDAPKIISSNPPNFSTNFNQIEIKIAFNEWIQPLSNAKNQILFSPSIEPFPKITISRNDLSIQFKDTLLPNTTYSIFFGDHLKDNNEGNPLTNFKYLFSTGNYIDSLKIKGSLKTSLDKIPENTFLMLYKDISDTAFINQRPFYISKIEKDGHFNVENVKDGTYNIFALSDKNNNFYYDLPTEEIAFLDSSISMISNLDSIQLELFLPEDTLLRIQSFDRIVKNGALQLTFNKEISFNKDDITVQIRDNSTLKPIAFTEKNQKTMRVYFPKMQKDTNDFTLIVQNNQILVDSIQVHTTQRNSQNPVLFFTDTLEFKKLQVIETQPLKLLSSQYSMFPIDTTKLSILDSTQQPIPFTISRDADLQTYWIQAAWKPESKYTFHVSDSVLMDLAGNYNKNQKISFVGRSIKKYGNLLINYELPAISSNYIAILKDISGNVIDKRILNDSQRVQINYGFLLSGNYTVEVIQDLNKNGIWNSGNFYKKTLPEKIYKELKPIIIKENWDAEETINVDFNLSAVSISKTFSNPTNIEIDKSGFGSFNKR